MHALYVEKKPEHRQAAESLLAELRETLKLPQLTGLRILQRYLIEGLSDEQLVQASTLILSEPFTEDCHAGNFQPADSTQSTHAFAIEFLPGQFDQRADSAAQCIAILTEGERPTVTSAQIYLLAGDLSDSDLKRIKTYLINPVDSHETSVLAETIWQSHHDPAPVATLTNFIKKSEAELSTLREELGLAMSLADFVHTQAYFRDEEQRDPSLTEIKLLDTYWSDHCRHTTFLTKIDSVIFDAGTETIQETYENYRNLRNELYGAGTHRPETLMDLAIIAAKHLKKTGELDNVEDSEEINAASIIVPLVITREGQNFTEDWLIQFKNETHNHPTEIEPFGGAATCLGGCIRDPLSGRAYVYQAMRVTGAWDPRTPFSDTLPGKLPQRTICREAAHGYSSYGNQIGLATGQVSEIYHPGYLAKRLEIGAVVAASPRSQVQRGTPTPGDIILLIGGRTGRDGIGGATGSSKEHTDTALENSAEVQKGDAPTERKIQRLFRNPELSKRIKRCNDFGAGGISVAIGELADSLDINLDAVPKKYQGLDGTELAISESQERMAVVIDPTDRDFFITESDRENLECVHVATVTDTGRLIMTWRDQTIVNLTRAFLDTNGVQQSTTIHITGSTSQRPSITPKPHLTSDSSSTHENRPNLLERCTSPLFAESIGRIGQTIADLLRRVHRANIKAHLTKPQNQAERLENERALRTVEEQNLRNLKELFLNSDEFNLAWLAAKKLGGAEQKIYPLRDGSHYIKANNGSYHGNWLQYLERLHLHQLLFPETAYELLGLIDDNFSLAFVVKQKNAKTALDESGNPYGATRKQVENVMTEYYGAFRIQNDNYYLPSHDIFIEDLHNENVLLADDGETLLFIDPVLFYRPIDMPIPTRSGTQTTIHYSEQSQNPKLKSQILAHLSALNHASQKGLGEMFDGSVGAGTVLWPFGGKSQLTPPDAMVAKVPVLHGETDTCTHMAWAYDPYRSSESPFHGSVHAVAESVCKLVATGARLQDARLTFQEYFPKLGTDPARWGLPLAALLGAFHAQMGLRLAAIGGKDSMSGSFKELDVPPTLVSFALAPSLASLALSPEFKQTESTISLVSSPVDSEDLPIYSDLIALCDQLHELTINGQLLSLKYLGQPGLAHALTLCCLGNSIGAKVNYPDALTPAPYTFLLEHTNELPPNFQTIGHTTNSPTLTLNKETILLSDLQSAYTSPLESVYPTTSGKTKIEDLKSETLRVLAVQPKQDLSRTAAPQKLKPRVLIPAFPGTNSEYDSACVFQLAGAETEILVFRNLTAEHIHQSLHALAKAIRQSQILFIPGGFSAGDEPDGSAKFIATILRNPQVADAIADLHQTRQGLILGICNGFQALVKSGLLPFGNLHSDNSNFQSPTTLAHNTIRRHISHYITTRVSNNWSPWLTHCEIGDLHTLPVSHGEGRFLADEPTLQALTENGQIAFQYVNPEGHPTMTEPHNPNGSLLAIEGITSPCGRILGKMAHTERRGSNVAKNIPGNRHQPLFKAGVDYFT